MITNIDINFLPLVVLFIPEMQILDLFWQLKIFQTILFFLNMPLPFYAFLKMKFFYN